MTDCMCSDEYGPCELHCTVLVQRVGSSNRSADELCLVFLSDAEDIQPGILSAKDKKLISAAEADLAASGPFTSWIDDVDLAQAIGDIVQETESLLDDAWVIWDDGYTIVRPSADCPLLED